MLHIKHDLFLHTYNLKLIADNVCVLSMNYERNSQDFCILLDEPISVKCIIPIFRVNNSKDKDVSSKRYSQQMYIVYFYFGES